MLLTKKKVLQFFLLFVSLKNSISIEKHWLPDLEWQTETNWIGGLLPDANSRVIFPEETWHAVGLPTIGNLEVAEIYLSREGSMHLGKNGVLKFTDANKTPKNVRWSKKGVGMWIDPDNWDGHFQATPHAERIPCDNDIVVLPSRNRTFSIVLPEAAIHVRGVRISGETTMLNRWEWSELVNTQREFYKSHLTVTYVSGIQLQVCNDCTCHGDMDKSLAEEVCSYMLQMEKCLPAVCEYPLKVEGHCCDYCGGRIRLSRKTSLQTLKSQVDNALRNYRGIVTWHIRKMWNGDVEVLISETELYNGIDSQQVIYLLLNALKGAGYEILEHMGSGLRQTGSSLNTILVPVFAIPIILVFLILATFAHFGYSYPQFISKWRGTWSIGFSGRKTTVPKASDLCGFARFENIADGAVRLDDNIPSVQKNEDFEEDCDLYPQTSSNSKRFENPLYSSKRQIMSCNRDIDDEEKTTEMRGPVRLTVLKSQIREAIDEVIRDK